MACPCCNISGCAGCESCFYSGPADEFVNGSSSTCGNTTYTNFSRRIVSIFPNFDRPWPGIGWKSPYPSSGKLILCPYLFVRDQIAKTECWLCTPQFGVPNAAAFLRFKVRQRVFLLQCPDGTSQSAYFQDVTSEVLQENAIREGYIGGDNVPVDRGCTLLDASAYDSWPADITPTCNPLP